MKIKTTIYRTECKGKSDRRLTIGIDIYLPDGGVCKTSATVQLHPISYLHGKSSELSFALLYLSAIVYAIDRAVDRGVYSVDGWSREFDADFIVPCFEAFVPFARRIDDMLSFLTGDYWTCHFFGEGKVNYAKYNLSTFFDGISQVNLFSGGLDSLIGAIDYITDNPDGKLFLASHYDAGMPGPCSDQKRLRKLLRLKYDNKFCALPAVMITPGISKDLSCRSRSLMFLSIALVVASYAGCDIVVPENGSVSLNFPLSPSRRSSCSTRTTHPVFLKMYRELLGALGFTTTVSNPYEKMTKGEMVRNCSDRNYLLDILSFSNSCGKRSKHQFFYDNHNASHCGHCMPCMYRKAALNGFIDRSTYGNKLITLFRKRGGGVSEDFFAMLNFLKNDLSTGDIKKELRIAGLSAFSDLNDYVDLVVRTREELKAMIIADNNPSILQYLGLRI